MKRNPGFDGTVEHKIEDGGVTEFRIVTDKVTDISPIRVFNAPRVLNCSGAVTTDWHGNGQLVDLTPPQGNGLGWPDCAWASIYKDGRRGTGQPHEL